jgi:hypothetical protein
MALKTYISVEGNKVLFSNGGIPLVKFRYHQATFDDAIFELATPTSKDIQRPHQTLAGTRPALSAATSAELAQMTGLGNLATAAGRLDKFRFFESAVVAAGAGTVAAVAGTTYIVVTGAVTYDGVEYQIGETFVANETETATSGTGTLRIWFPATLLDEPAQYTAEAFKIVHLGQPTDALSYWEQGEYGFTPQPAGYIKP